MSEFIREAQIRVLRFPNGSTLEVEPSFDVIHRFGRIGAHILKFWNPEAGQIRHIIMNEAAAEFIHKAAGLYFLDRDEMTDVEHDHWMQWKINNMSELDFDVDENAVMEDDDVGTEEG